MILSIVIIGTTICEVGSTNHVWHMAVSSGKFGLCRLTMLYGYVIGNTNHFNSTIAPSIIFHRKKLHHLSISLPIT